MEHQEEPNPANVPTSSQRSNSIQQREMNTKQSNLTETVSPCATVSTPTAPDGGYGWVCVACSTVINAHTWGAIAASYGIFLSHYLAHNTFPGTSEITYACIGGLILSQAVLTAPLATYLVRVFGTRACLFFGNFWLTLGLVAASFAEQGWQIVLSQGICSGWGIGLLFVGNVAITSQWFEKRRSLANAINASGTGLGALIYSLATQSMIDSIGICWAFRILAIVCCVANTMASLLLRDRNQLVGSRPHPFRVSLMKRPEFVCLQIWSFLTTLGYTGLAFSVSPQAVSVGLSAKQGALLNSLYNLGQAVGRPLMGLSSDKYGRINVAFLSTLLSAVTCIAFWTPSAYVGSIFGLLLFFNLISGCFTGVFWTVIAPVATEVVGLPELPSALSMIWLSIVPSTMFVEPLVLAIRLHGSAVPFIPGQVLISMIFGLATLPLLYIRAWKIGEMNGTESNVITQPGGGDVQLRDETKRIEVDEGPNCRIKPGRPSRGTLVRRTVTRQRV